MTNNPLGQKTEYRPHYDPSLLFPIERHLNRTAAGIDAASFSGYDCWNCHELGWLNRRGKPEVRRLRLVYPADSRCIIESKSLKLYLGSFIMTKFDDAAAVQATIQRDLAAILGAAWVEVSLLDWREPIVICPIDAASLIDELDVACEHYDVAPALLKVREMPAMVERCLVSNLLKTNCPITGQPDWATVWIEYRGRYHLDEAALLRYLVSYREHGDYHELCCEQICRDLAAVLAPEQLAVKCYFTRRGGIDINPGRFVGRPADHDWDRRYWRQ